MTDRLLELAARCEAATGPELAIDFDIAEFVTRAHMATGKAPKYTASLDAAIMLVPEPGKLVSIHLDYDDEQKRWFCELDGFDVGDAATRALALCAAALRARAATPPLDRRSEDV